MSALPRQPMTLEEMRSNDRHRPWVVVLTMAVLAVFLYLFSSAPSHLGLPTMEDFDEASGEVVQGVGNWVLRDVLGFETHRTVLSFEEDGSLATNLEVTKTTEMEDEDERLITFLAIGLAFLFAYFLPIAHRQTAMAATVFGAFAIIFGPQVTSALVLSHLLVYATFHPDPVRRRLVLYSIVAAGLATTALPIDVADGVGDIALQVAGLTVIGFFGFQFVYAPLLGNKHFGGIARTLAAQAPIFILATGVISHALTGHEWSLPLGLILFFWQWQRLMIYHVDYRAGAVPKDLGVFWYMSIFFSPAIICNWSWGPYVGQAYAYLAGNYLCEDKNKLILSGLKLWGLAMLYFCFWHWFAFLMERGLELLFDTQIHPSAHRIIRSHLRGDEISTPCVLFGTLLEQIRVFFNYGSVLHFTVGTWHILGYRVDPQYNKWWLATNLVVLWGRFAFHLRQFLVSTVYYPVFFRFFRKHRKLRIFTATLAAAGIGNLVLAHVPSNLMNNEPTWGNVAIRLERWPYFLLLGVSISLTQVYLMSRKRRRRAWTRDRWFISDIICAYLTFQFFSLIHIYDRPQTDGSFWEYTKLLLIGCGIHL